LDKRLCTLVLNVSLRRRQQSADGVHVDAALDEAGACPAKFVETVVVGGVHHSLKTPRGEKLLQAFASQENEIKLIQQKFNSSALEKILGAAEI